MTNNWTVMMKKADFYGIAERFGISPVMARLLRNRNLITDEEIKEYLTGDLSGLHDPYLMAGMEEAVDVILDKIDLGEKIRVIGDYDIDGVNATYILVKGLRSLEADVDWDIPDRMKDGYGMNISMVQKAFEAGIDTIVTCDNGIAAYEAVSHAKSLGMTVVVTDHHQVPYVENADGTQTEKLPPADAVIDPHRSDCPYPYKALCGASVALKLLIALFRAVGIPDEEWEPFLENSAFATVGDVMHLTGENRILVKEGLKRLPTTENLGLKALLRVTNLYGQEISTWQIGFILGPCINATGRLDTAKRALELLLTEDPNEALELANDLVALNDSRKNRTREGLLEAVEIIESKGLINDRVLVVFLPNCHESVAGIIAGRLKEKYSRPAFVLTRGEESIKGSGRSVEGYSMYDELVKVGDLFIKFGGHPMAAGLSLYEENIGEMRRRLNENCKVGLEELAPKVKIDMPLPFAYATFDLIEEMKILEPTGEENSKPLFGLTHVRADSVRVIGKTNSGLRLTLTDPNGTVMPAVYFGDVEEMQEVLRKKRGEMDICYQPGINEFRGERNLQINIRYFR